MLNDGIPVQPGEKLDVLIPHLEEVGNPSSASVKSGKRLIKTHLPYDELSKVKMKWKEEDPDVGKGLSTNIYKEDIDPGNCTIFSDCRLIIIATLEGTLFFLLAFGSERDCTSVRWLTLQESLEVNKNGIPMIGFFILIRVMRFLFQYTMSRARNCLFY